MVNFILQLAHQIFFSHLLGLIELIILRNNHNFSILLFSKLRSFSLSSSGDAAPAPIPYEFPLVG